MARSTLFSKWTRPSYIYSLIILICIFSLGYAYYAQLADHVEACPLCIAQRIVFAILAILAGIALINHCQRLGNKIYAVLLALTAIFGIKIAAHHVHLQNLPAAERPLSCGMPLDVLYQHLPLSGFIHVILSGSAECAMVTWRIFGLPAPLVSLIVFNVLLILALILWLRPSTYPSCN